MSSDAVKRRFTAAQLITGKTYYVMNSFIDYDGITHTAGESWRFVAKNFLPHEDGLTLVVERDGRNIPFRLQWRPDTQGRIIDRFSDYVAEL